MSLIEAGVDDRLKFPAKVCPFGEVRFLFLFKCNKSEREGESRLYSPMISLLFQCGAQQVVAAMLVVVIRHCHVKAILKTPCKQTTSRIRL